MHPRHDLVRAQRADGFFDQLTFRCEVVEPQLTVFQHLLDLFGGELRTEAHALERHTPLLPIEAMPGLECRSKRRSRVAAGRLNKRALIPRLQGSNQKSIQRESA